MRVFLLALLATAGMVPPVHAQDPFEIQVYDAETAPAREIGLETHLNSVLTGRRATSPNGEVSTHRVFHATLERLGARVTHIHAGRPQTNGHVEALHKTILDECWRPAFARYLYPTYTGLRRELERYLAYYNHDRVHHGRLTRGRIPADLVYGARKMEAR